MMTQPSSPRRATAKIPEQIRGLGRDVANEIAITLRTLAWPTDGSDLPKDVRDVVAFNLARRFQELLALPSTHDEAIRAEEREGAAKIADAFADEQDRLSASDKDRSIELHTLRLVGLDTARKIAAHIRARASSPRPVPAEGDGTRDIKGEANAARTTAEAVSVRSGHGLSAPEGGVSTEHEATPSPVVGAAVEVSPAPVRATGGVETK